MSSASNASYGNWSHEDLVKRVTQLEGELKAQHEKLSSLLPQPAAEPARPPTGKKKPASFDPSKYTTRYIALKFAYLGGRYNGFEHHVGNPTPLPTIEEELWKALVKTRLIFPPSLYGEDGVSLLSGRGGVDEVEKLPPRVVGDWTGCEYSKCGRTDRGVSAFGQVVGLRVRSARPKEEKIRTEGVTGKDETDGTVAPEASVSPGFASDDIEQTSLVVDAAPQDIEPPAFDTVKDELPYIALLNRVLPPDIRVLAWCPHPPPTFDARFSCKERKYRYFFTSPAFLPLPGTAGISPRTGHREGWLDIPAMQKAASYLVGTHDFRNFCKVDASKQLTSFARRITDARVEIVAQESSPEFVTRLDVTSTGLNNESKMIPMPKHLQLYSFDVQGSAFLWHQVRCMVAVLFLVGQGLEKPEIVKQLLDAGQNPRKPHYEMASDQPLVLWDCMFSIDPDQGKRDREDKPKGYVDRGVGRDELDWVYAADTGPGSSNQTKWSSLGLMADFWKAWRKAKIDEVLAAQLLDLVSSQGTDGANGRHDTVPMPDTSGRENQRVFEGYDNAVPRGKYVPVMQRPKMDPVEVTNARWAARKGRAPRFASNQDEDGNE